MEQGKEKEISEMNRREFVKKSSQAILGAGVAAAGLSGTISCAHMSGKTVENVSRIPKVPFGKTGLMITRLGCGGTAMRDATAAEAAVDAGMNLCHTASRYTGRQSLPAFAQIMPEWRDKVVLCLKDSPDTLHEVVPTLNTDHVDAIFPAAQDVNKVRDPKLKENFDRAKEQGLVRFLGFACHKNMTDVVKAAVDLGYFDCMLIAYSDPTPEFLEAVGEAKKAGMGILSMKGTRPRRRRGQPREEVTSEDIEIRIRRMLFEQHVDSVLMSVSTVDQAREWSEIGYRLWQKSEPTAATQKQLSELDAELMASCGFCGKCSECPQNVDICAIQRYLVYHEHYGRTEEAIHKYRRLGDEKTVLRCADCGTCEERCPRNLPVRAMLKRAHSLLA